jgi:hypothetical protein
MRTLVRGRLKGLKKLKFKIRAGSLLPLNNLLGPRVLYFKEGFVIIQMGR